MSQDQGTPAPATPASVTGESQGTPTVINTPASTPAPPAAGATNHPLVWSEILLWHEPLQTAVVFLGGLLAFGLLTFAAYGTHQMTLVSGEILPFHSALLSAPGQCIKQPAGILEQNT
eukprot:GHRR01025530.1.p3 GENE.GHRR01025530.1~~GHRR01025530.1.p3  ORF type:complete len:118 (-),score=35.68 GHRR01025530.1:767-1120(-)